MTPDAGKHEQPGSGDIHARVDHAADKVKQGTANTVGAAMDKVDAAADRTQEGLQNATDATARGAHKAADKADEWRERGAALASDARDRANRATDRMVELVRDRPVESIAIALAAGWLLGRVLNRGR
ncbi:MAG: DUF883 family protein [Rhodanobacteraceae bacterium]